MTYFLAHLMDHYEQEEDIREMDVHGFTMSPDDATGYGFSYDRNMIVQFVPSTEDSSR